MRPKGKGWPLRWCDFWGDSCGKAWNHIRAFQDVLIDEKRYCGAITDNLDNKYNRKYILILKRYEQAEVFKGSSVLSFLIRLAEIAC